MRIEFTLPGRVGGVTAGMYQKHIHTKLKRWGAHHNICTNCTNNEIF